MYIYITVVNFIEIVRHGVGRSKYGLNLKKNKGRKQMQVCYDASFCVLSLMYKCAVGLKGTMYCPDIWLFNS